MKTLEYLLEIERAEVASNKKRQIENNNGSLRFYAWIIEACLYSILCFVSGSSMEDFFSTMNLTWMAFLVLFSSELFVRIYTKIKVTTGNVFAVLVSSTLSIGISVGVGLALLAAMIYALLLIAYQLFG